jgi:hypothetical protein
MSYCGTVNFSLFMTVAHISGVINSSKDCLRLGKFIAKLKVVWLNDTWGFSVPRESAQSQRSLFDLLLDAKMNRSSYVIAVKGKKTPVR